MALFDNLIEKVVGTQEEEETGELSLETPEKDTEDELSGALELEEDVGPAEEESTPESPPEPEQPKETTETETLEEGSEGMELTEIEDEIDRLADKIATLEREKREIKEDLTETSDETQKLFKVYEILFRGLNPYDEGVKEVDEDLLGEDVFNIFKKFVGGEGEGGVAPKIAEDLEERVEKLEKEIEGVKEGKVEEKESLEDEYKKALKKTEKEKEKEEKPEPKWDSGNIVFSPKKELVRIKGRNWDPSQEQWRYECKVLEEGSV